MYEASLNTEDSSTHKKGLREQCQDQGYLTMVNACSPAMDLRKLVNHPYLIRFPVYPGTRRLRVDEELVTSSGKMLVLDAMLAKLKQQGHKVQHRLTTV